MYQATRREKVQPSFCDGYQNNGAQWVAYRYTTKYDNDSTDSAGAWLPVFGIYEYEG
jgi:hypothetical protein